MTIDHVFKIGIKITVYTYNLTISLDFLFILNILFNFWGLECSIFLRVKILINDPKT